MFRVELRSNVFRVYAGLIASGYDLFALLADDPVLRVIDEIRRTAWPECVTEYFARAKNSMEHGVNPYWPRAAMLLTASFHVNEPEATWTEPQLPERLLGSFPAGPEDKAPEILKWLSELPDVWDQMSSGTVYDDMWARYQLAAGSRIQGFHRATGHTLDSFVRLTGVSPQDLPRVCVVPNPLQAPQVADFVARDGVIYTIVAEPRPSSIVHELLHAVFGPGVQAAKDRAVQFSRLLRPVYRKMVDMQYAWDQSPESWLRVFEENLMRAASIWIEHAAAGLGSGAVRAQACAQEGFIYVPVMVRLFFEEWKGMEDLDAFIENILWTCDRLS